MKIVRKGPKMSHGRIKRPRVRPPEPRTFKDNGNHVTCSYMFRLGNNMFQIGAAASLAKRYNKTLVLSPWRYSQYFDWNFKVDPDLYSRIRWRDFIEPSFTYSPINPSGNVKLHGFYQSEKYLEPDLIRTNFRLRNEYNDEIMSKYGSDLVKKSTSVHIRRTDYLTDADHPALGLEYYHRALEILDPETEVYFVFSDDIEWCRSNLNLKKPCVFVEGNTDIVDMFTMSKCKGNIIANSTFSWWASYLNPNRGARVVCPAHERWFSNPKLNPGDLICKDWILV